MAEEHAKRLMGDPSCPFPVGTEYYRAPMPPQKFWDEDFAAVRASGMRIIRTFSFWNWMEPQPGCYELDDFDRFFELAAKYDLKVWFDITLATHGACPEWLTREYPDIRIVLANGQTVQHAAHPAMPQGRMIHCYDHPKWKEYGEGLLRAVISRYKDAPNLIMWGIWDGAGIASVRESEGYPCYCRNTIAKYIAWLRDRYTLEELNERLLRRYRRWEDVAPPRDNNAIVEMLLYREFHYDNLQRTLRWQREVVESIDADHEVRAHGASTPRQWDEMCAKEVDSWGMSMSSNNLLTSDDPYQISDRYFSFDWSRSIGKGGRWWNEEIYSGMSRGGATWKKQSDPAEVTTLLWMTLAGGAAGCMYWQYTPEYLSFEGPGYCLTAPDRTPTVRLEAVSKAIGEIEQLSEHLPLEVPKAEAAVVYSPKSHEIFSYNGEGERYVKDVRGVYRTLWENNIAVDVLTPGMEWSGYKVVYLANGALMDGEMLGRIKGVLEGGTGGSLVVDGNFGSYVEVGYNSYNPPEGLVELIEAGVADYSRVTVKDIADGKNVLRTAYGEVPMRSECGYSMLKCSGGTKPAAWLGDEIVGVETAGRKLTWYGCSLSAGFGDVGSPEVLLPLFESFGVTSQFELEGDRLLAMRRKSKQGGSLVFLFNLEMRKARTEVGLKWEAGEVRDLLEKKRIDVRDNSFNVSVDPGAVKVVYCDR